MAERPRYSRWTAKDRELMPWLVCDYVDYGRHDYLEKEYQGQKYEVRKRCTKLVQWIVERGERVYRRCQEHKTST
jgi:hypothetical protein